MSSSSTKRKTRKNGLGEPSGSSPEIATTEAGSLSERDFEEITSKVERSLGKRLKEQSDVQQEMLKVLNVMQSKFDELSRNQRKLTCANGEVLEFNPSLTGNTIDDENTYVPYGRTNIDDFPRTDEDHDNIIFPDQIFVKSLY